MEAVGTLVGGIAHDFNNLLAVVLGNLELLRKRLPQDAKITRLLDNTSDAAQRGASLTRRMLAFARRQDLKVAPVNVAELVRDMADLLQRSIGPTVQIETRFPLRLAPAYVDANQLELALLNLVVNARDAMAQGGTVTIAARSEVVPSGAAAELPPGDYVCLSVTDTGIGMDEATLARAVEPFYTTKEVGKGTGLGLSMVHGLAEQSGGRLVLKSRPGQGTTAEIWLPVPPAEVRTTSERGAGLESAAKGGSPQMTILAVDDDSLVLTNTAAMLEDLGCEVIEASSGEQALRILRRAKKVDLVITDQLMPGMIGTQLIDAIRSEWPHLRVILATGYAELPPGTDPNLPRLAKPYLQEDLRRAILNSGEKSTVNHVLPFRPKKA
jgi:CheY-like chemotaxis protein/anti-sigma regulatory factor (Ser/Thr protein kinase)